MKKTIPKTGEDIANLIYRLGDADRKERLMARELLKSLGEAALPAITSALFKTDENIRWQAAKIFSEMKDPATAETLVKVLADDDLFGVRWLAAEGLIGMKRDCLEAVLRGLINHPDSVWLRQGVHHVLHSLHEQGLTGNILDNVLSALEGGVHTVEIPVAAKKALDTLELNNNSKFNN